MGLDGAENGTAMILDETIAAEEGPVTDIANEAAASQLSVDRSGLVGVSISSVPPPLEALTTASTTPALVRETQHDLPTDEVVQTLQVKHGEAISSSTTDADQTTEKLLPVGIIPSTEAQADVDAPEEYGDEDGGVIRCICECDDDDGFTIQCDRCLVWQHCACFGMSQASVPEEYHCERCNPRPVDVEFAKAHQQKRREAEVRKANFERTIRRHNQNAAAMSTATAASAGIDGTQAGAAVEVDGADVQRKGQQGGISRSRKPSQQIDLSDANFNSVEVPSSVAATPGSARSYKRRGGAPKTGPRKPSMVDSSSSIAATPRAAAMMSSMGAAYGMATPALGRVDDRADADDTVAERMEAWQVEFTPTSHNIIAEESIMNALMSVSAQYTLPLKAERGSGNRHIAPVVGKRVKVLSQVSPSTTIDASKEATFTARAEHGLTPIGNECVPVEIESTSLTDCTQRTYVKLISEIASASIFSALLQVTPLPSEPQRPWSANKAFSKPVMHGLFADASIPAGCFISEYNGELSSADTYRKDPINQYQSTGTTKSCVHLLPPPLNLCIDARRYGNTTRFARFSCHPNAVVRPIVLKASKEGGGDDQRASQARSVSPTEFGTLRFGIFAITDIPRTHEITLGWEWDDAHIVHLLPLLVRDPMLGMLQPTRLSSSLTHTNGNQRLLEREKRHAAMAALVEKGDFPYAGLPFSQKMNAVLTVLLGSCLCACIGSAPASGSVREGASAQSGGSTASSNNIKRQDCAISQMLRLSQGMSLLNVYVPGGSNTAGNRRNKIKAPDFEPLVGKRRWWRPNVMPLTPTSLPDDQRDDLDTEDREDDLYYKLRVSYKLLPGGKVGRVDESDFEDAMERDRVEMLQRKGASMQAEKDGSDGVDSDDSMLTVPLGRDSEVDEDVEDEEDDSLLLQDNNVTIAKGEGGASYLTRTALPPKKRVSGTRLKAINSAEENSDVEYKGKKKRKDGRKGVKISGSKAVQAAPGQRNSKKKRKRAYEPSSPLTSAPSQENSDESDDSQEDDSQDETPTPQHQSRARKSVKREGSEDVEVEAEVKRRKKDDAEARKKAHLAKKRRQELLGDLDDISENSSGNDISRTEAEAASMSKTAKKLARKKAIKQVLQSDESEGEGESQAIERQPSVQREKSPTPEAIVATIPPEEAAPLVAAEPPPVIELPKAKLSLAEYKKRLAEKRTASMNSQSNITTPLSTPGLSMTASLEKPSLPNTPSAAFTGQAIYDLPASSIVSEPAPIVTTPTLIKSEFAPPAPRFPRPMTPPRDVAATSKSLPLFASTSTGAAETSPVVLNKAEIVNDSVGTAHPSTQTTVLAGLDRPTASEPGKEASPQGSMTVKTTEKPFPSPAIGIQSLAPATSTISKVEDKTTPLTGGAQSSSTKAIQEEAKGTEASAITSLPVTGRSERAHSISKSADEPPAASIRSTSGSSFNPPKAPRAFVSPGSGSGTNAISPPAGPIRNVAPVPSISPYEARQQRPSLSLRHTSPSRQPHILASPSIPMGSPYTSTSSLGTTSLNDFANVPKGPARMRERERERERDIRDIRERDRIEDREYREPIPPPRGDWDPRDRDRDRERDWEREREREYIERDAAYRRDRSQSFDRRRLEDEDDRMDYMTPSRPIPPPYVPRGGGVMGSRGGFAASRGGGGIAPWAGRARTRGRGSRGAWR